MRYLLDTHAFIWLDSIPVNLSAKVISICKDPANLLFISVASIWEMQIKINAGKLTLPKPLTDIIQWQRENNSIQILPVNLPHIFALDKLPVHHRDPFDRMLITQAQLENLTILSRDTEFAAYPVTVVW
jgi:PIN domain nuclease of toxin-antitoxin system